MSLISHRLFMPKLLLSDGREGWSAFYKLLLSLFKFLGPFLKSADLQAAGRDLYRGTLRLLLVLLHDFPEFLAEYYFSLCDVIPPRCIQLRNIILSAYPPNIILPDPHLPDIDFESIPEMGPIPPILSDFAAGLRAGDLRLYLDQFLLNRNPQPTFLSSLKDRLLAPPQEAGAEPYNLSLINSLVMYIGVSSVAQARARSAGPLFVPTDPGAMALHYLATNLDVEGMFGRRNMCGHVLNHFIGRPVPLAQRDGPPPALPERAHPLVHVAYAPPVPRDRGRQLQGGHDQSPARAIPRPSPSPLGSPGDVHRAPPEPEVPVQAAGLRQRRTRGYPPPRERMCAPLRLVYSN